MDETVFQKMKRKRELEVRYIRDSLDLKHEEKILNQKLQNNLNAKDELSCYEESSAFRCRYNEQKHHYLKEMEQKALGEYLTQNNLVLSLKARYSS